jgi:hypothetical protein
LQRAHTEVREYIALLDQQREAFDNSKSVLPVNDAEFKRLGREIKVRTQFMVDLATSFDARLADEFGRRRSSLVPGWPNGPRLAAAERLLELIVAAERGFRKRSNAIRYRSR